MSRLRDVDGFKLIRKPFTWNVPEFYAFVDAYVGPDCEWQSYDVMTENVDIVHTCSISTKYGVYVVWNTQLVNKAEPHDRLTIMRLHQMIMANYVAAGGDLGALRYVAFHRIRNAAVRQSILDEIGRQRQDQSTPQVIVKPSSFTWSVCEKKSPVIRSVGNLAQQLWGVTGKDWVIRQVVMLSGALLHDPYPTFHMVIEIGEKKEVEEEIDQAVGFVDHHMTEDE
ncbi:hypothetical protein SUNI508_03334 [Seiridium unicorne]|uniref:Uncharacterized protein n=1 Tax=Seiridium unicorne TaxID=138068 RepID=A0ABR2VE57_9PEZI